MTGGRSSPSPDVLPESTLPLLRFGVALCFIGHGAFGVISKQAWLPYFAVVGIGEASAWRLMPWIGALDIAVGFLALVRPCRALFAWAVAWAVWTALLRPLAGQAWPEFFERAGNYGVPLALLVAVGLRGPWFARLTGRQGAFPPSAAHGLAWTLRVVTAALLLGHAGCALLLHKASLAQHYTVFNPANPAAVMMAVGWCEVGLAGLVLVSRSPSVLLFVAAWKLASESLFLISGASTPLFEVIERGGSYVAPLVLAGLQLRTSTRPVFDTDPLSPSAPC